MRSEPPLDGIVTARGDTLCLDGLKHGETYEVELLAGFPAATGETTAARRSRRRVVVPDRKPPIRFSGAGYVLPREGSAGLPVTTINVDKVKLRLLRVNERNLVPSIDAERLTMSFRPYEVDEVINRTGSLVWEGEMAIAGERNRPVVDRDPAQGHAARQGAGRLSRGRRTHRPDAGRVRRRRRPIGCWSPISGSTAYTRARTAWRSMVRSLADGKPLPGSRSASMPATTASSPRRPATPTGIARIPGGLLRGRGGDEPFVVTAYGPDGDFNFLEIGRAAFDLSDRGVSGRPQPGPVDAFLYTDRGIYRPGESVELVALVRDDKADAIVRAAGRRLRLVRPDGVEVEKRQLTGDQLGALSTELSPWRATRGSAPGGSNCGSTRKRRRSAAPNSASRISCRRSSRSSCPPPTGRSARASRSRSRSPPATITARPEPGWRSRPRRRSRSTTTPSRTSRAFSFGLVDEEFTGDRRDIEAPGDRRRRQGATVALDAERSAGSDPAARRDDPGQRVRAERPRGLRDRDPADPAAPAGDRAALAGRRRRGAGGQPRRSSR